MSAEVIQVTRPDEIITIPARSGPLPKTKRISKGMRILVATSLWVLLVLPLILAMVHSHIRAAAFHKSVDPATPSNVNYIWPESEYRIIHEDEKIGPNSFYQVYPGLKNLHTFKDINGATFAARVYLIERLYGEEKKFGVMLALSDKSSRLVPPKTVSNVRDRDSLKAALNDHYTVTASEQYNPDTTCNVLCWEGNSIISDLLKEFSAAYKSDNHPLLTIEKFIQRATQRAIDAFLGENNGEGGDSFVLIVPDKFGENPSFPVFNRLRKALKTERE